MKAINIVLCILILSLLTVCSRKPDPNNSLKDFKLQSLMNDEIYELRYFNGKPLILNFWASWCEPCKKEMPFLESMWKKYENSGLVLIGINVMDSKEEALNTLKEFNISYINLLDPDGNVLNSYNIFALPVTYFVRRDGTIYKIKHGPFLDRSSEDLFNSNLEEIMK